MNRTNSLHARQDLLALLSGTLGLVTGSETGADWAADVVHYYEGMNSLVPFRDPNAGYTMGEVIDPPPPGTAFNVDPAMTGFRYLTSDRMVQQTRFANGASITVNFSDQPWTSPEGKRIEAGGWRIQSNSSSSTHDRIFMRIVAPGESEIVSATADGLLQFTTMAPGGAWRLETTGSLTDALWSRADFGFITSASVSAEARLPWRPLNDGQTLREDMSLCGEAIPHGVPAHFAWRDCPRLSYGNNPQHLTAMIPWGQLYVPEAGNTATNTRVHIRDLHEPDGGISVRLIPGYNFHFWSTAGRVLINTNNIAATWACCEARLILHDPAAPDDRDTAQYILSTGADYWLDLTAQWAPSWLHNGDIGIGRFKFARPAWRAFNMHSMSEEQLNNHPPPMK